MHPLTRSPSITVILSGYFSLLRIVSEQHTTEHPGSDLQFNSDFLSLSLSLTYPHYTHTHITLARVTRTHKHPSSTCMSLLCQVYFIVLMLLLLPLVLQVHKLSASLPTTAQLLFGFMEPMMSIECLQRCVKIYSTPQAYPVVAQSITNFPVVDCYSARIQGLLCSEADAFCHANSSHPIHLMGGGGWHFTHINFKLVLNPGSSSRPPNNDIQKYIDYCEF